MSKLGIPMLKTRTSVGTYPARKPKSKIASLLPRKSSESDGAYASDDHPRSALIYGKPPQGQ